MTPQQFRASRHALGLSVKQMAAMLGCDPLHVRRMEMDSDRSTAKQVMPMTRRLVQAFLDGYRPADWPE